MEGSEEKIQQFCELTQASVEQARFFLESHKWQLDHAVSSFYENDGAMGGNASTMMDEDDSDDEDYKPPPQQARAAPAPALGRQAAAPSSSSAAAKPKKPSRFASIADFREEEVDDDKQRNQYYAGGSERSGQMIEGAPKDKNDESDVVKNIFNTAKSSGAENYEKMRQDKEERKKRNFGGSGV